MSTMSTCTSIMSPVKAIAKLESNHVSYPYLDERSHATLQLMQPKWVYELFQRFRKLQTALELPAGVMRRPDHTVYKLDCQVLGVSFSKNQVFYFFCRYIDKFRENMS